MNVLPSAPANRVSSDYLPENGKNEQTKKIKHSESECALAMPLWRTLKTKLNGRHRMNEGQEEDGPGAHEPTQQRRFAANLFNRAGARYSPDYHDRWHAGLAAFSVVAQFGFWGPVMATVSQIHRILDWILDGALGLPLRMPLVCLF